MTTYPVVLFLFKRPNSTAQFLQLIKNSGTKKIYVFSDGPRNSKEEVLVKEVRQQVTNFAKGNPQLELITHFAKVNQGLKNNLVNGLNLVFSQELAAIVIEDDCLPSSDFFKFANEMLTRFKDNSKVFSVNGTSPANFSTDSSYTFTKYPQCWGWATWSRAWKYYDPELTKLNEEWEIVANKTWKESYLKWYFHTMFNLIKSGQIDTWDFQWSWSHFKQGALAIVPAVNLVKNIGFDQAATNTTFRTSVANLNIGKLAWPLTHPPSIEESLPVSELIENKFYRNPIAFLGIVRQYFYYLLGKYAHRT